MANDRFVCLVDETVNDTELCIHQLSDPATGQVRPYIVSNNTLCEITVAASSDPTLVDYQSFLVNNYIIRNGKLYTITPVDALFWMLLDDDNASCNNNNSAQWQPLEQVLHNYNPTIVACIDRGQLVHVLEEINMGDETYYKFSINKTLTWLKRKQNAVFELLQSRYYSSASSNKEQNEANNGTGAFASGFSLGATNENTTQNNATKATDRKEVTDNNKAREESIQIVCNYLSETWRKRFLEHLQVDESVLGNKKTTTTGASCKKPKIRPAVDYTALMMGESSTSKEQQKAATVQKSISAGAKRLQKVSTKGMKKMSAFFTKKKKTVQ